MDSDHWINYLDNSMAFCVVLDWIKFRVVSSASHLLISWRLFLIIKFYAWLFHFGSLVLLGLYCLATWKSQVLIMTGANDAVRGLDMARVSMMSAFWLTSWVWRNEVMAVWSCKTERSRRCRADLASVWAPETSTFLQASSLDAISVTVQVYAFYAFLIN